MITELVIDLPSLGVFGKIDYFKLKEEYPSSKATAMFCGNKRLNTLTYPLFNAMRFQGYDVKTFITPKSNCDARLAAYLTKSNSGKFYLVTESLNLQFLADSLDIQFLSINQDFKDGIKIHKEMLL